MHIIKKEIEINAPVERVYEFCTQPNSLKTVWPNLTEVSNVKTAPGGGHEFDFVYKMAGFKFHGHSNTVVARPYEYIEARNEGGIPSTFRWRYQRRGNATTLNLEVEYTIATPLIGKLAEAVVARTNERDADTMLSNLKRTLEASLQPQPAPTAHP